MLETSARLPAPPLAAPGPPGLDRPGAGGAPGGDHPHGAQRRGALARPGLPGCTPPGGRWGATAWGRGPPCPRCCWTTKKRWRWWWGCARPPGAPCGGSRRPPSGPGQAGAGAPRPPPAAGAGPAGRHRPGALGPPRARGRAGRPDHAGRGLPRPPPAALRLPRPRRGDEPAQRGALPPGGLGGRWFLVAWDTARRDWRTFRVDRIEPRPPHRPPLRPRDLPEGDIAAYVSRRVSSAGWRYRARVTVHAPAEQMRRADQSRGGRPGAPGRDDLRPGHRGGHGGDPGRLPGPAGGRLRGRRSARSCWPT